MARRRRRNQRQDLGALPPKVKEALAKAWETSKRVGHAAGQAAGRAAVAVHGKACAKAREELEAPSVQLVLKSGNKDKLAKGLRAAQWSYEKTCKADEP